MCSNVGKCRLFFAIYNNSLFNRRLALIKQFVLWRVKVQILLMLFHLKNAVIVISSDRGLTRTRVSSEQKISGKRRKNFTYICKLFRGNELCKKMPKQYEISRKYYSHKLFSLIFAEKNPQNHSCKNVWNSLLWKFSIRILFMS